MLFILLIYIIQKVFSGHIYSLSPEISYQNVQYFSKLSLFISFDNSISSSDYIYLKFPLKIGQSSQFTFAQYTATSQTIETILPIIKSSDPSFTLSIPKALFSGIWYKIQILIADKTGQTAGFLGCVEMKTLASSDSNSIIFDESNCVGVLSLFESPDISGLNVVATVSSSDVLKTNVFATSYKTHFDIISPLELISGANIDIFIDNNNFIFENCINGKCQPGDSDCPKTIESINFSTCIVNNNKISFNIASNLTKNVFRITANIRNPNLFIPDQQKVYVYLKSNNVDYLYAVTLITSTTLIVKTNYPTFTLITIVKLMWGLLQNSDSTIKGCPLSLFTKRNPSNYEFFNSLKTEFVTSSTINSFSLSDNLVVIWIPTTGNYISSFLSNSLITNFPIVKNKIQKCSFTQSNSQIKCIDIGDLSASFSYIISGKFSLSHTAADNAIKAGKIEIQTGTGVSIVSSEGTSLTPKMNQEYIDTTATYGWFHSNSIVKKGYNYFFSYVYTSAPSLEYSGSNSIATIYTSITNLFLSSTSKVGIFIKPTTDSSVHALFFALKADQTQVCKDGLGSGASKCISPGVTDGLHILLKIVFNNNVLGIPSSDYLKGVVPVGCIFSDVDGTKSARSGYNTETTQGKRLNKIEQETQAGQGGGIYHHVSLLCEQANEAGNDICHAIAGRTSTAVRGISFVNTQISSFVGLYQDNRVLDFVICFKYLVYASFAVPTITESYFSLYEDLTGHISGPGAIQAYVISGGKEKFSGDIKASLVNYYYKSTGSLFGDGKFIASYLRVGFNLVQNEEGGSKLGIFLLGGADANSLSFYADANNNVKCVDLKGTPNSINGKVVFGSDAPKTEDFWWSHNSIILEKKIVAQTEYNFYVPIKITSKDITSLNIVILNDLSNFNLAYYPLNIYRIFGSSWSSATSTIFSMANVDDNSPFTTQPTLFTNDASSGCKTSGSIPKFMMGSDTYKPGVTLNSLNILSDLGTNGAKCTIALNSGINWGGVFVAYFSDNVISNSLLTWDFSGSSSTNKCVFHTFFCNSDKGCKGLTESMNFYTIICSIDSGNGVNTPSGSSLGYLRINQFKFPFYWGKDYIISTKVQYVWSLNNGLGVSVIGETGSTNSWVESTCILSSLLNLPINSLDYLINLRLSNKIEYLLLPLDNSLTIDLIIAGGNNGLNFANCDFNEFISCSVTSTGIYTLNNPSSNNYKIGPSGLMILTFVDTTITFSGSFSANIKYKNIICEICSTIETIGLTVNNLQNINTIILSDFSFVNMKNARNTWSFTFSVNNFIKKTSYFLFNLGFFSTPTVSSNNYRFAIFDGNNNIAQQFSNIDGSDLANVKLYIRQNLQTGGLFILKCIGGSTSDNSNNNDITASVIRSDQKLILNQKNVIPSINIYAEKLLTGLVLKKKLSNSGFEADYYFSFKPSIQDIDSKGRIYIEFSKSMSEKLGNSFECYLENFPIVCDIISPRRLSIVPNIIIKVNNTLPYTLQISGVSQPNQKDENWAIYLAFDNNTNVNDGIVEQTYLNEPDLNFIPTIIKIEDFVISSNLIRSLFNLNIQFQMTKTSIFNGYADLIIGFDWNFRESFMINPNLTCFCRLITSPIETNYVKENCNAISNNRIAIKLTLDTLLTSDHFILTINNILSPQKESLYLFNFQIFNLNELSQINSASFAGSPGNSSIKLVFNQSPSPIITNWVLNSYIYPSPIPVGQGVYSSVLILTPSKDKFLGTCTFIIQTPGFTTIPKEITLPIGSNELRFLIAADENTKLGIYTINWSKIKDLGNIYGSLPGLLIKVINDPCTPLLIINSVNVPPGGMSNPIVIDFSFCKPSKSLKLIANVSSGYDTIFIGINGKQIMEFEILNANNNKIIFYANSYARLSFLTGTAVISFKYDGIQSSSFKPPNNVLVKLIEMNTDIINTPTLSENIISIGNSKIKLSCDQSGIIYYIIGLDTSPSLVSWFEIMNLTEKQNIERIGPLIDDENWFILGFKTVYTSNTPIDLNLEGILKADSKYSLFAWLKTQTSLISKKLNFTWYQPDNGGKLSKINFEFKGELTQIQKNELTCILTYYFQLNPLRVLSDDGLYCNQNYISNRLLQAENATKNNTVVTNETSNNNIPVSNEKTQYNFYFLKNHSAISDNLYQIISPSSSNVNFYANLMKLTTVKFPVLSSISSNFVEINKTYPSLTNFNISFKNNILYINVSMSDVSGYIFIGIGEKNQSKPNKQQLKAGVDGSNLKLLKKINVFTQPNELHKLKISNLPNKTSLNLFLLASNEDISSNGLSTDVITKSFRTNQGLHLNYVCYLIIILLIHIIN